MNFKALAFFVSFSSLLHIAASGQSTLAKADSLFQSGKYTEAFGTYDSLLLQREASPQMLLKMAFIQEGLQDYTSALYYLSLYYELSGDKKVLSKMTEIAEEHQLVGYEFDDVDFAANLFDQYRIYFVLGLTVLAVIIFVVFLYQFRTHQPVAIPLILEAVIVCGLFLASNNIVSETSGIIASDHTILRSAPSAAAEPLEMINKGHRVVVLSIDDVWLKIEWQEQAAYLRRGRVKII